MTTRSTKLKVESLDGRIVPSAVAYGDINHDGLTDKAAITANRTVTVSLANPNGTYTVSAVLTASNGPTFENIGLGDYNADGNLDVGVSASNSGWIYSNSWLGNGDGTFGAMSTTRFKIPKNFI